MRSAAIQAIANVDQLKARDHELRVKLERAEADEQEASNKRQRARCTTQRPEKRQRSPGEGGETGKEGNVVDERLKQEEDEHSQRSADQAQIESVLLQGEFANKHIRVGEEFQAAIPPVRSPGAEREDQLIHVVYEPLTEPPKPAPILTLKQVRAAEAAASAAAEEEESDDDDIEDFDDDGEPLLPDGVVVGGLCLASGTIAGERRMFKATLLSMRRFSPHLLVKYLGDEMGRSGPFNMPDSPRSYLTRRDVAAWVPPEERPASAKPEVTEAPTRPPRLSTLKPSHQLHVTEP